MFDFGFSEILLIFVLALVVLGPEKLPRVASQVGRWIGRARGMARQFREQLEEEITLEEARKTQKASPAAAPQSTPPPVPPNTQVPPTGQASPAAGVQPATELAATPGDEAVTQAPAHGESRASEPVYDAPPEPHNFYPPHYSHAHPTDELGRDISAPAPHGGEPVTPVVHDTAPVSGAAPGDG